ncbi:YdeI family protein [uncultured Microbacterium sp.]|uniref:YdeI/OmpD-associated family protein n=1 Tax=uncultured Microbacterium sp. TaxID=191216 RepID=UPI002603E194|nr:YdeI/OmpD-associated family protein [uncultured Microbacterium sp.]
MLNRTVRDDARSETTQDGVAMGVLDDGERVTAADAAAWRAWLEDNHQSAPGVWLLNVRGSVADGVDYEDAVRHALCFGWIDGPVRTFAPGSVGQWFSPRRRGSGWAATNKARLAELEAAGLLAPAGIRVIEAAKADGSWTVLDGPEAGIEPDDFAAALDAVPAARENWDAFPPSARKLGLTLIATAKRPETRAGRIGKIVADAAAGKRP